METQVVKIRVSGSVNVVYKLRPDTGLISLMDDYRKNRHQVAEGQVLEFYYRQPQNILRPAQTPRQLGMETGEQYEINAVVRSVERTLPATIRESSAQVAAVPKSQSLRVCIRIRRYGSVEKGIKFSLSSTDQFSRLFRVYQQDHHNGTSLIYEWNKNGQKVRIFEYQTPSQVGLEPEENSFLAYTVDEYTTQGIGKLPLSRRDSLTSKKTMNLGALSDMDSDIFSQTRPSFHKKPRIEAPTQPASPQRIFNHFDTYEDIFGGAARTKASNLFNTVGGSRSSSSSMAGPSKRAKAVSAFGKEDDDLLDENLEVTDEVAQKSIQTLLETFNNVRIPKANLISQLRELKVELKEYQRIGVTWMKKMEQGKQRGGILSDEMGLGKTVQTISLLLSHPPILDDKAPTPTSKPSLDDIFMQDTGFNAGGSPSSISGSERATLIVLPLSLMEQWKVEIETLIKPAYKLQVLQYHGDFMTTSQRRKFEQNPDSFGYYDVVLTTYQTLANQFKFDKNMKRLYTSGSFYMDRAEKKYGPLFKYNWYRVVLDEAHTIKNRTSQSSVAASYLMSKYRWCLTGTPIQNSSDDLFALLRFLKIKPYCYWRPFKDDLSINPRSKEERQMMDATRDNRLAKLQTVLQCCLLRRTKNSKIEGSDKPILELPPREFIHSQPDFTLDERTLYIEFESRNVKRFENLLPVLQQHYSSVLLMIMRMRQMCLHYLLVTEGRAIIDKMMSDEDHIEDLIDGLKKDVLLRLKNLVMGSEEANECPVCLDAPDQPVTTMCGHIYCAECLVNLIKAKEDQDMDAGCPQCRKPVTKDELIPMEALQKKFKVVDDSAKELDGLFNSKKQEWEPSTKITELLRILRQTRIDSPKDKTIVFCSFTKMLDLVEPALRGAGIRFVRLDGTMKIADRVSAVNKLRQCEDVNVMLISLKCGSVGLNLTAANRVILLDLWWNPALENQAIDRVHRIGQLAEKVYVTKITIPGTIEDRILKLQEAKQDLVNQALGEGGNMKHVNRLSRNDLIFLFRGSRPSQQQQHNNNGVYH